MATQYYFLISSLPLLRFGAVPFLSSSRFLELVAEHEGEELAASLSEVSLLPGDSARFPAESFWYAMETYIRNYLLRARCRKPAQIDKWKRQDRDLDRDVFPGVDHQLHKALGAANPLERERMIDELRWDILDEALLGQTLLGETFSVNALVVYRIRLLLAEKWQGHSLEKGRQIVAELVEKAQEEARQTRLRVSS